MTNPIQNYPTVALRGMTVLPGMIVHFDVSRERSIKAVEAAMMKDQKIFLITQKDPTIEEPIQSELYRIGILATVKQVAKLQKGMLRVLVEGLERAQILSIEATDPYLECETIMYEEEGTELPGPVREAMCRGIRELFQAFSVENGKMNKDLVAQIELIYAFGNENFKITTLNYPGRFVAATETEAARFEPNESAGLKLFKPYRPYEKSNTAS